MPTSLCPSLCVAGLTTTARSGTGRRRGASFPRLVYKRLWFPSLALWGNLLPCSLGEATPRRGSHDEGPSPPTPREGAWTLTPPPRSSPQMRPQTRPPARRQPHERPWRLGSRPADAVRE